MSRKNKVNRDNYTQAGRLTPDDMARERQKQVKASADLRDERITNHQADARRAKDAERETTPRQTETEESE